MLEIEISRSLSKFKALEKELTRYKQSKEQLATWKLDGLLKTQKVNIDRICLRYTTHGNSINK